jgi:hypothetical protein
MGNLSASAIANTMNTCHTYTVRVPDRNGRMVPFQIQADSVPDLHRRARVLFLHVWNRIEWPDDTAPQPRNPESRP